MIFINIKMDQVSAQFLSIRTALDPGFHLPSSENQ